MAWDILQRVLIVLSQLDKTLEFSCYHMPGSWHQSNEAVSEHICLGIVCSVAFLI